MSASLLAQPLIERNRYSAKLDANPCSLLFNTGKIEVRNKGNPVQLIEQLWAARGQLRDQRLHVVQHRRQSEGEKQGRRRRQAQQQEKDRQPSAGMPLPDVERVMPRMTGERTTAKRALT